MLEIANELNYTKGNKSRAPKGPDKKTTLGLITRHTDQNLKKDPYYWEIIQGIMFEAAKWRLRANTVFNMHDQKKDWTALRDYAAIAILGEVSDDFLDEVAHYNKNIILVDYYGKTNGSTASRQTLPIEPRKSWTRFILTDTAGFPTSAVFPATLILTVSGLRANMKSVPMPIAAG